MPSPQFVQGLQAKAAYHHRRTEIMNSLRNGLARGRREEVMEQLRLVDAEEQERLANCAVRRAAEFKRKPEFDRLMAFVKSQAEIASFGGCVSWAGKTPCGEIDGHKRGRHEVELAAQDYRDVATDASAALQAAGFTSATVT